MKLYDFLLPSDVLLNVRAADSRQLLEDMAKRAAATLDMPEDTIVSALLKREDLGSTGVGNGVAIPHARFEAVKKPFGILARLKQPVDFNAIDGQPVDLIFVLLLPAAGEGEQLGALASVARKLRAPDILTRLRQAKSTPELYAAVGG
jgi:PTS system nitrogen regulatory IIA component